MGKKCPPGVICIENITLYIVVVISGIIIYLAYMRMHPDHSPVNLATTHIQASATSSQEPELKSHYEMMMKPGHGYGNNPHDVLMNPYVPPVNMAGTISMSTPVSHPYVPPGRMPVNVATNVGHMNTSYTQVGILTPTAGSEKILALMGRQLHTSRQKWQYYTISDNNNSVKLPVIKNGKSCTNEYGCDELSNGDSVFVEGYNQAFRVTIYENDALQYIPYI